MDKNHSITLPAERKRGQHFGAEERRAIQQRRKLGYSNRIPQESVVRFYWR